MLTGPAREPVGLEQAKDHLRIDHSDEDALILGLITTARAHVENVTGRSLITQTWRLGMDGWPSGVSGDWWRMMTGDHAGAVVLPKAPVQSIDSIQYVDEDGVLATLSTTLYELVQSDYAPAVVPVYQQTWPVLRAVSDAVRITFKAGYGDMPASVPAPLQHAILLLIGHYYANREAVVDRPLLSVPLTIDALLSTYRVNLA